MVFELRAGAAPPHTENPSDEGRVYLAVVMDAWNRQVIGHSIAEHLRAELVGDALDMACWRACRQVGEVARPVSTVADEFGVCWWTGSSRRTPCISERESV
jgi:transposase InsO family protein